MQNDSEIEDIRYLVDGGISAEMLLAGARIIQDRYGEAAIDLAASTALDVFVAMRDKSLLSER